MNVYCPPQFHFYLKYNLEDFAMFRSATNFYGKFFNDFCSDVFDIMDINSLGLEKISNKSFHEKIIHLYKCELLSTISFVFFHFRISIILKNIDKKLIMKLFKTLLI